jgi:hypothetical protein
MKKKGFPSLSTTAILPPPLINLPKLPIEEIRIIKPKKVIKHECYLLSDGYRRIFTERDALIGYGQQRILDPRDFSYINLFINGVLQPPKNYEVKKGKIILMTDDIPVKGAPIILQMVRI